MDQRAAVRVPVRVPAMCRSDGAVIDGFVEDLSRTGLFFRTPEAIAAGAAAVIQLDVPGEAPLELAGEVVRVERDGPRPGVGVRIAVAPAARRPLANFLMRQHAALR